MDKQDIMKPICRVVLTPGVEPDTLTGVVLHPEEDRPLDFNGNGDTQEARRVLGWLEDHLVNESIFVRPTKTEEGLVVTLVL